MMKLFSMDDLKGFVPNRWSDPSQFMSVLQDEAVSNITVWDGDKVAGIISFKAYWANNYVLSILLANNFRVRMAPILKRALYNIMDDLNVERVQTDSIACIELDMWHEYFGFTCEGLRKKMYFGEDYKSWAIVREVKA